MIGKYVITLVLVPVLVLIVAFVLDKPRNYRVPALFLGSLLVQIILVVAILIFFGAALSLLVPQ